MTESASKTVLVRGVDIKRVDLTTLTSALKEAGIKFNAKTSLEERVTLLADHELEAIGDDDARPEGEKLGADCDQCFGVSLLSRDCCPFCGTGDTQPAEDSPVANPSPRSAKEAKAKKAEKPAEDDKPAKKKRSEVSKAEPAEVTETKVVKVDASAGKITKAMISDLDQRERRITGLMGDAMEDHWKLGHELKAALDEQIWKRRIAEDGKPVYGSFAQWCVTVFNISAVFARSLMAVSVAYTAKEVRAIGPNKLDVILKLPPEKRAEMVAKAAGMSHREVQSEVRRLAPGGTNEERVINPDPVKGRPGVAEANKRRAREAAERPKARVVVADNEVTTVIQLQRYEVPLFARAKSAESGESIRAKNVASDPHAALDLQNGVRAYFQVVEDDEGLSLIVEYKRVDADAAE
jgi:hypothetical protein